jgi:hypothetical protein
MPPHTFLHISRNSNRCPVITRGRPNLASVRHLLKLRLHALEDGIAAKLVRFVENLVLVAAEGDNTRV